jgi:hypothetical protein
MLIGGLNVALFFVVVFLWISIWGIVEITIDKVLINRNQYRFIVYLILLIISLSLYYIIDTNLS